MLRRCLEKQVHRNCITREKNIFDDPMERKIKFAAHEYYHVYDRGVEKRKIFLARKDYDRFIALMYAMNQEHSFHLTNFLKSHTLEDVFREERGKPLVSILSYVLMPNHFHMLMQEHMEGGISKFMMRLLTAYSMYFNIKYQRSGPLFIHPFRSQHISDEPHYLWIFSYIHMNPIGIIKKDFEAEHTIGNRAQAENFLNTYQYSSFLDYQKSGRPQSKILDLSLVPDYVQHASLVTKKYEKWLKYQG